MKKLLIVPLAALVLGSGFFAGHVEAKRPPRLATEANPVCYMLVLKVYGPDHREYVPGAEVTCPASPLP